MHTSVHQVDKLLCLRGVSVCDLSCEIEKLLQVPVDEVAALGLRVAHTNDALPLGVLLECGRVRCLLEHGTGVHVRHDIFTRCLQRRGQLFRLRAKRLDCLLLPLNCRVRAQQLTLELSNPRGAPALPQESNVGSEAVQRAGLREGTSERGRTWRAAACSNQLAFALSFSNRTGSSSLVKPPGSSV